ncbi:hypothetical protein DSO57_1002397 [Entomophthora muscae]|uniref:Uncharacterized protein n=1 Tax=Entomophthora muscae TaxID=34485 RepID=A0ACC2RNT4_9FUNG|nr:hypothetical protein DSO57_1002397 [Entomophthora muscae]
MEPPVTPKPMPAPTAELPLDHTNKLFRIVYITLTGVIDTIVPATGLWLWLGKSMSYLIKLAPILWWALPTQSATCQFPDTSKPANQGWFPDTFGGLEILGQFVLVCPFGITDLRLISDVKHRLNLLQYGCRNIIAAVYRAVHQGHPLSGDVIYCFGGDDLGKFLGQLLAPGIDALPPFMLCSLDWLCQCHY